MADKNFPSPRKNRLCKLIRSIANAFIAETESDRSHSRLESAELRNEVDSMLTLYECGLVDPVSALREHQIQVDPARDASESAPLTGTHG